MESDARGQSQGAYALEVASSREALLAGKPDVWDSGRVGGRSSLLVPYAGPPLESARAYFWRARVEDAAGRLTDWSAPARFVTALADAADWGEARWIGYEDMPERERLVPGIHGLLDPKLQPKLKRPVVPLLRRVFVVRQPVARALLFVSGLGHYEAYLNGEKVGDRFLAPGWTDYDRTVLYDAFDVTAQLRVGPNAIAAIVGNGFHHIAPERYHKLAIAYGWPKLLAALRIEYADGHRETISTGPAWKAAPSPITFTSIYGGEDFDARLEPEGWTATDFDDTGWGRAAAATPPSGRLQVETDHPLRVMETLRPVSVKATAPGVLLYDFGQNASGIVRLRVRGEGGRTVTLTPSELLTPDGRPNQKASGEPYRWTYTLRGGGEEAWAPRFTYYGFRYVQVEGAVPAGADGPADLPRVVSIEMAHTRNSAPETGRFETSLPLFNRIDGLVRWAIRSNLASVLTDCPHREKLGWLEQTYLMGDAVHFDHDLFGLYRKQVADVVDAQAEDGLVPDIAPEYVEFEGGFRDSPEWGGAGVIVPWLVYRWYGDRDTLERAWPAMKRYVDYLGTKAEGHIALARARRLVRPRAALSRRGAAHPESGDGHRDLIPLPARRRRGRSGPRAPGRRRALRSARRGRPRRLQPGLLRPEDRHLVDREPDGAGDAARGGPRAGRRGGTRPREPRPADREGRPRPHRRRHRLPLRGGGALARRPRRPPLRDERARRRAGLRLPAEEGSHGAHRVLGRARGGLEQPPDARAPRALVLLGPPGDRPGGRLGRLRFARPEAAGGGGARVGPGRVPQPARADRLVLANGTGAARARGRGSRQRHGRGAPARGRGRPDPRVGAGARRPRRRGREVPHGGPSRRRPRLGPLPFRGAREA